MVVKAVIFDMDGVLIDSEPSWQQTELRVFGKYGVPITLQDALSTQGMRTDEVVRFWYGRFPWKDRTLREVSDEIHDHMIDLISKSGEIKVGVMEALKQISSLNLPIAIASSSTSALIAATVKKLGISDFFKTTVSAEHLENGKPHPEVFLVAADRLGVKPQECLVIEDSFNGVVAAKAARMKVVAVPDDHHIDDARFVIADKKLRSLQDFKIEDFLTAQ